MQVNTRDWYCRSIDLNEFEQLVNRVTEGIRIVVAHKGYRCKLVTGVDISDPVLDNFIDSGAIPKDNLIVIGGQVHKGHAVTLDGRPIRPGLIVKNMDLNPRPLYCKNVVVLEIEGDVITYVGHF